jgi:hypothetical protein
VVARLAQRPRAQGFPDYAAPQRPSITPVGRRVDTFPGGAYRELEVRTRATDHLFPHATAGRGFVVLPPPDPLTLQLMLRLYAPVAVALLAIVGFTAWEAVLSDRFVSSSMTAEEFGKRFEQVPMDIGPWKGTNMIAEKATLEIAGAVNHVSRRYVNQDTKQEVDMWLIVGHARDICRHTPDICYPSQGYSQIGTRVKQRIEPPTDSQHPGTFFTAKFHNESSLGNKIERVFWSFNGNEEGKDEWEAPESDGVFAWLPSKSAGPKNYYGNNTALYKMYFTAPMSDTDEDIKQNVAIDFAELALPLINKALFPERYAADHPDEAAAEAAATATPPATEPAAASAAPAS